MGTWPRKWKKCSFQGFHSLFLSQILSFLTQFSEFHLFSYLSLLFQLLLCVLSFVLGYCRVCPGMHYRTFSLCNRTRRPLVKTKATQPTDFRHPLFAALRHVHRKKKVREFLVPSRDVTTKLSLGRNVDVITELFLPRGSLVSDIPAGDGKLVNLFLRCRAHTHPKVFCAVISSSEPMTLKKRL
jgi:hypothetical protein